MDKTYTVTHSTKCRRNVFACAAENVRDASFDLPSWMELRYSPAVIWHEFKLYLDNLEFFMECDCDG